MTKPQPDRTPTAIETVEDQPHDEQLLRQRLLQLIVKSEAKRRSAALTKPLPQHRPTILPGPRSIRTKLAANRPAKKRA